MNSFTPLTIRLFTSTPLNMIFSSFVPLNVTGNSDLAINVILAVPFTPEAEPPPVVVLGAYVTPLRENLGTPPM